MFSFSALEQVDVMEHELSACEQHRALSLALEWLSRRDPASLAPTSPDQCAELQRRLWMLSIDAELPLPPAPLLDAAAPLADAESSPRGSSSPPESLLASLQAEIPVERGSQQEQRLVRAVCRLLEQVGAHAVPCCAMLAGHMQQQVASLLARNIRAGPPGWLYGGCRV